MSSNSRWSRQYKPLQTSLNNMYNPIYRKSEADTRKRGIIRINIIRKKATNARVAKCKIKCQKEDHAKLGTCVLTNTTMGIKDCMHQKDGITRYHYIRPCELAVDTLQYAFNTSKSKIIHDETGDYLTFENFPTLQIETVNNGVYTDTRREGFYNAYEDLSTLAKISYEEQIKQYLETNIYYNSVKILNPSSNTYIETISNQDITYVHNIASTLQESCNFNASGISINQPEKLKYDLSDLDPKYIILETVKLASTESNHDEEYVICGYPDKSKMAISLSMYSKPEINASIVDIHNKQKTEYARLFSEMHNQTIPSEQLEQRINLATLDNPTSTFEKLELYKFMKSLNITYFENWIKQNEHLDNTNPNAWVNSADFTSKIKFMKENGLGNYASYIESEIAKTCLTSDERGLQLVNLEKVKHAYRKYVNALMLEYLNKPITRIRYHFLIYKVVRLSSSSNTKSFELLPFVFNIKQLEFKHKPLLEKVLDLIQTELPMRFAILEGSRFNLEKYKLFHSYVNYGDYFYVSTEYLHTMSNLSHYAYKYENSMELEELIYSLSSTPTVSGNPFWQELKIIYRLKIFRIPILPFPILQENENENNKEIETKERKNNKTTYTIKTSRTNKRSSRTSEEMLNGIIMMIYEKSYQQYVIIYKDSRNTFQILEIKSNLASIKKDMLEQIRILNRDTQTEEDKTMMRYLNYSGKLFRIIRAHRFTSEDMLIIKKNNPLIVKVIKPPFSEKTISIQDMIKTELLDNSFLENLHVSNVSHYKPIIYFNCFMNQEYLNSLLNYINNGKTKIPRTHFEVISNFSEKYGIYCDTNTLINPFHCGYNILEVGDKSRKVIWILPFSEEYEYLINFTSLNAKHILLLETIKKLYLEPGNLCFIHIQSTHIFGTLHFHITNYDDYESRKYPLQGSSIIKEININQLINTILINSNYYTNYTINLLNLTI